MGLLGVLGQKAPERPAQAVSSSEDSQVFELVVWETPFFWECLTFGKPGIEDLEFSNFCLGLFHAPSNKHGTPESTLQPCEIEPLPDSG